MRFSRQTPELTHELAVHVPNVPSRKNSRDVESRRVLGSGNRYLSFHSSLPRCPIDRSKQIRRVHWDFEWRKLRCFYKRFVRTDWHLQWRKRHPFFEQIMIVRVNRTDFLLAECSSITAGTLAFASNENTSVGAKTRTTSRSRGRRHCRACQGDRQICPEDEQIIITIFRGDSQHTAVC